MTERLDWSSLRRLLWFGLFVTGALVTGGLVYGALLVPILVGGFLTYLLLPLVDRLEKWKVPRSAAAFVIIVGSLATGTFGFIRLIPLLYQQVLLLARLVPAAVNTLLAQWLPLAEKYISDLGLMSDTEVRQAFAASRMVGRIAGALQGSLLGIWKTGASLAGGAFYLVLIPLVTFFLLKDYHLIAKVLRSLVPRDLLTPVGQVLAKVNSTFRDVLKGQAIVAGILMLLYIVGLSIVGLQSAILIGTLAGICRVIPYLDVIVGGSLSAIVLLSNFAGWGQVLSVVLVFLTVQAVDGAFITPHVIGERVGIHPMLVILSVLAFGDWLGIWGVILAIPMAAMVKVLIVAIVPYYRDSRAYLGGIKTE